MVSERGSGRIVAIGNACERVAKDDGAVGREHSGRNNGNARMTGDCYRVGVKRYVGSQLPA